MKKALLFVMTVISLFGCSDGNDDNNNTVSPNGKHLVSIYMTGPGNSKKEVITYDFLGRVSMLTQHIYGNDGGISSHAYKYTYTDTLITVQSVSASDGLANGPQYDYTYKNGRVVEQTVYMGRFPNIEPYNYDAEGHLTAIGQNLYNTYEWSNGNLVKMPLGGAIVEYTYSSISNTIPNIVTYGDPMLEWKGYYGKRTPFLPSRAKLYAYVAKGLFDDPELVCYESLDYNYTMLGGVVTKVERTTHVLNDMGGVIKDDGAVCTWTYEYE